MKTLYFFVGIILFSCNNSQSADKPVNKFLTSETAEKKEDNNTHKSSGYKNLTIDLKSYGAKGLGISSLKEDDAALRKAIAALNKNGGGKLYVPNPPKFYAMAGDGVFVGDNIEIYGDGKGKSEIRNVSPLSGNFLKGPIFLFSTYGPVDKKSIFQNGVDQYPIQDAKKNDPFITLKNKAQASKLYEGEVVVLGADKFLHGEVEDKGRFHFMELNEISSIKDDKIYFKYPLSVSLSTDKQNNPPAIVNINNTTSMNRDLGIKNGTSKNIYIHDMTLSQAQSDEVTGKQFTKDQLINGLSTIWQPGGAFGSTFKNLAISCYGGIGGNMFTRCNFNNIDLQARKKFIDFGYGASNDTLFNINWSLLEASTTDFSNTFVIINDGTHNILMYNINASGDWVGDGLFTMSQADNITFHDITINFPKYSKPNSAISIGGKGAYFSRNISLSDMKITLGDVGQFLTIGNKEGDSKSIRNISISNVTFNGNIITDANHISASGGSAAKAAKMKEKNQEGKGRNIKMLGYGVLVQNISGLKLSNLTISSGNLMFLNCNNSEIEKIHAPASSVITKNSDAKFAANTFKSKVSDDNRNRK